MADTQSDGVRGIRRRCHPTITALPAQERHIDRATADTGEADSAEPRVEPVLSFEVPGGPDAARRAREELSWQSRRRFDRALAEDLRGPLTDAVLHLVVDRDASAATTLRIAIFHDLFVMRVEISAALTDETADPPPVTRRLFLDRATDRWGILTEPVAGVWFEIGRTWPGR